MPVGVASGRATREDAERTAIEECGGPAMCSVVVVRTEGCAVVVIGRHEAGVRFYYGAGDTIAEVRAQTPAVLDECGENASSSCRAIAAFCAAGSFSGD
jgi:hypothetical protein